MAGLEDLAALLTGGGYEKPNFAANNPYANVSGIGDSLTSEIMRGRGNYSNTENIVGGLLTGLLSGTGSGLSDRYQSGAKSDYNQAMANLLTGDNSNSVDLPPALFNTARNNATLFNVSNKIQNDQADLQTDREIKKVAAQELFRNPGLAKRNPEIFSNILGIQPESQPAPIATPVNPEPRSQEGRILDEIAMEAERLMESGAASNPTQAMQTARGVFDARKQELARSYEGVEQATKSGRELAALTDQLSSAYEKAGYTGKGGDMAQFLSGIASPFSKEQEQKYSAGQDLDSLQADIVGLSQGVIKGPMSDRDVRLLLQKGVDLTTSPTAKDSILDRFRYAAALQTTYGDFMRQQREEGTPVYKAEAKWNDIVKANPLIKDGVPNPLWQKELGMITQSTQPTETVNESAPATEEAVPPGYELTGKVDANGNKGIRKIR